VRITGKQLEKEQQDLTLSETAPLYERLKVVEEHKCESRLNMEIKSLIKFIAQTMS
jgi:hypothetical protein